MSTEIPELDETPGTIVQEDQDEMAAVPPLPVTTVDPVQTQAMPSKVAGMLRYDLSTTVPQRILAHDPRRRRALVQGFDFAAAAAQGVALDGQQSEATSPYAFVLATTLSGNTTADSASTPVLEITSQDEVWAVAVGGAITVSVMNEQWAL